MEKSTADTQAVWQVLSEPANSLPPFPANLLNDLKTLSQQMMDEVFQAHWLDAYLLAAGMDQVVQDYLHPDPLMLDKAAGYLQGMLKPAGPYLAVMAQTSGNSLYLFHKRLPQTRYLQVWEARLWHFLENLAAVVLSSKRIGDTQLTGLRQEARYLDTQVQSFPTRLQNQVLRLPSCFRSFDQQPADLKTIAHRFSQRWPDRNQPLVVVGIRTSGNYLAPLYSRLLKNLGYQDVSVITLRPGRRLLPSEQTLLQHTAQAAGLALLCDDPPSTGKALAKAARSIEQVGFPAEHIILMLQLFGTAEVLPPALRTFPAVLLPWQEWSIQRALRPQAVLAAFNRLLEPGWKAQQIRRLSLSKKSWERSHVRALFEVDMVHQNESGTTKRYLFVEGSGLGYFAEHAVVVAEALDGFVPQVYGLSKGLLFQEGFPEQQQLHNASSEEAGLLSKTALAYITLRRSSLPARRDFSQSMFAQNTVWEVASNLLSKVFGRAWQLARLPLVDPVVKQILRPRSPAIIDGNMDVSNWFSIAPDHRQLVKSGFARRAFSNLDLACYDPVYDLAQIAIILDNPVQAEEMRTSFESGTGEKISPERWLLYQMVNLWQIDRCEPDLHHQVLRSYSLLMQRYYAEILFHDLKVPQSGPLVALDVDGVLETQVMGFSATTPAGARALCALNQHGYRVVIATGRSLVEVRERCNTYRLAGGVAEYGSAIYDHSTGAATVLLSQAEIKVLDQLRGELSRLDGVQVDTDFKLSVRAFWHDERGQRTHLSDEQVKKALDQFPRELIRPVPGRSQTDFVISRVDKGSGLRALAAVLGVTHLDKVILLAVGDSQADLPMLRLAERAYAPANADESVRQARVAHLMSHSYQAGLLEAIERLICHHPGECRDCELPPFRPETNLLFSILSVQEDGLGSVLPQALDLSIKLLGSTHG